jgi:hypothetical protein
MFQTSNQHKYAQMGSMGYFVNELTIWFGSGVVLGMFFFPFRDFFLDPFFLHVQALSSESTWPCFSGCEFIQSHKLNGESSKIVVLEWPSNRGWLQNWTPPNHNGAARRQQVISKWLRTTLSEYDLWTPILERWTWPNVVLLHQSNFCMVSVKHPAPSSDATTQPTESITFKVKTRCDRLLWWFLGGPNLWNSHQVSENGGSPSHHGFQY